MLELLLLQWRLCVCVCVCVCVFTRSLRFSCEASTYIVG